jgi:hypothetical protein
MPSKSHQSDLREFHAQSILFPFPSWWRGPKDYKVFGAIVLEALRYKQGRPSLHYDFPHGDPFPLATETDLQKWVDLTLEFESRLEIAKEIVAAESK